VEYVNDSARVIRRKRRGRSLCYVGPDDDTFREKKTLARIRALVIPLAWKDDWICCSPNGHLQVTGRDARGRKQYRYYTRWREIRGEDKEAAVLALLQQRTERQMRAEASRGRHRRKGADGWRRAERRARTAERRG
jgi:DNA topoisomerase I